MTKVSEKKGAATDWSSQEPPVAAEKPAAVVSSSADESKAVKNAPWSAHQVVLAKRQPTNPTTTLKDITDPSTLASYDALEATRRASWTLLSKLPRDEPVQPKSIPSALKNDVRFWLVAVLQHGMDHAAAIEDPALKRTVLSSAVLVKPELASRVTLPRFGKDIDPFVLEYVVNSHLDQAANWGEDLLRMLPKEMYQRLFENAPALLARVARSHPKAMEPVLKESPALRKALLQFEGNMNRWGLNIVSEPRLVDAGMEIYLNPNVDTVEQMYRNRLGRPTDASSPKAVVIFPQYGRGDAAFTHPNNGWSLEHLAETHQVFFKQVGSDKEFAEAVQRATKDRPASLLVIAGHGSETTVRFSATARFKKDVSGFLDIGDGAILDSISKSVKPGGHVVFLSCSTGKGDNNLAKQTSKKTAHATVIAPEDDVVMGFGKNEQGDLEVFSQKRGVDLKVYPARKPLTDVGEKKKK